MVCVTVRLSFDAAGFYLWVSNVTSFKENKANSILALLRFQVVPQKP